MSCQSKAPLYDHEDGADEHCKNAHEYYLRLEGRKIGSEPWDAGCCLNAFFGGLVHELLLKVAETPDASLGLLLTDSVIIKF